MQRLLAQRVANGGAFVDQSRNKCLQESIVGHGRMRGEMLCLSDGSFAVADKPKKTLIVGFFTPQRKRMVDDLHVALYGLEFFEIPLEGFEVFQERRLSVWTGRRRHELVRQVRQLVRERVSDESQLLGRVQIRISIAQCLGSDRVDEVLGGS